MKYKPSLFPITKAAIEAQNWGATLAAGVFEIWVASQSAKAGIPPLYSCGNPKCNGTFTITSMDSRPLVCQKCGAEIDWTGIATKKVKRCPKCKRVGNFDDVYCAHHMPAVALEEVEEPL